MPRTFVEAHLDLQAVGADIAALEPPTITLDEVLDRLGPQITAASQRGATHEQIRDSLKGHGIVVSVSAVARIVTGDDAPPPKKGTRTKARSTQPPPPAAAEKPVEAAETGTDVAEERTLI